MLAQIPLFLRCSAAAKGGCADRGRGPLATAKSMTGIPVLLDAAVIRELLNVLYDSVMVHLAMQDLMPLEVHVFVFGKTEVTVCLRSEAGLKV